MSDASDDQIPPYYNDLDETHAEARRVLSRGVKDRRHGFHTPNVATIGLDGAPRSRTVVLRGFDPAANTIRFHTDSRSQKVAELAASPCVAMTFYDAQAKLQLRIAGRAEVHGGDEIAKSAWEGSRIFSRACYAIAPGPGTVLERADAFDLPADEQAIAAGEPHFRAVLVQVKSLEWLYLAHSGHRRARFEYDEAGVLQSSTWLTP